MTLKPADENSGISFRRIDIAGQGSTIPARWDHVVDTKLCTMIGNKEGVTVSTIEHLMAALAGCGIDNAEIEINGPEVPIMDGSAAPFVFLIECAGIRKQEAERRVIRIEKPIRLNEDGKTVELLPDRGFSLGMSIDFDSDAISKQDMEVGMADGIFKQDISRARTFGFLHEVEYLRSVGLAKGGSLDNAIVISADGVMNEGGLRFEDEFVRHKVLDAVGDLYLAGAQIMGQFRGVCSGHAMNNKLLHKLFAEQDSWSYASPEGMTDEGYLHSPVTGEHKTEAAA